MMCLNSVIVQGSATTMYRIRPFARASRVIGSWPSVMCYVDPSAYRDHINTLTATGPAFLACLPLWKVTGLDAVRMQPTEGHTISIYMRPRCRTSRITSTLSRWLNCTHYLARGISGVEVGSVKLGCSPVDLARLAFSGSVYTQSRVDCLSEIIISGNGRHDRVCGQR